MKIKILLNKFNIILVSCYFIMVALYLTITQKIPSPNFPRIARAYLRKPYFGEIDGIRAEEGHCWLASLPGYLLSDKESSSLLVLLEDETPLGPAHSGHEDIRKLGGGRFSHWGKELYFSTSDNSNPRDNGRRYTVKEQR